MELLITGGGLDAISTSKRDSRSFSTPAEEVMPAEIHSETCSDIGIIPGSVWWSSVIYVEATGRSSGRWKGMYRMPDTVILFLTPLFLGPRDPSL